MNAWLSRHEKDVFDKLLDYQYVLDIDSKYIGAEAIARTTSTNIRINTVGADS